MSDLSCITGHFSDDYTWEAAENGRIDENRRAGAIYGRSHEKNQFLAAYSQVIRTRKAKVVVLHGISGSGKTSLVSSLRAIPVCASGGFFCTGKFFQDNSQEPYSAIMAAFSDLCDLVLQSDDFDENRRCQIQEALGTDGRMLTRSITNFYRFLHQGEDNPEFGEHALHSESTFSKFKVACRTFLRAMASPRHPIVLFFDDIQWMDEASRDLFDIFLRDLDLKHILFVFAYRDEDAATIKGMFDECNEVVDIQLGNLELPAVHAVISSVIGTNSPEKIRELSTLVMNRTAGNPFYIKQFLNIIQREGFLRVDSDGTLTFEVDSIQREVMIADGLLDHLRLQRLDANLKEALKVASILGYSFDQSIVAEVTSCVLQRKQVAVLQTPMCKQAIIDLLAFAVDDRVIEKTGQGYHFLHDKLQSAFLSMLEQEEKGNLHVLAGEAYLRKGSDLQTLYNAALHLNSAGIRALQTIAQRVQCARVNYDASRYCIRKLAFIEAATFLRTGLALLDGEPDKWTDDLYTLTFAMTESVAKVELIVGNFDACKMATAEILRRAKSVEGKISSLLIHIEVRLAANEVGESIATANIALKMLGVDIPKKVGFRHVIMKFMKVKRMLRQRSDEDILALPIMSDQSMMTCIKILVHLSNFCSFKGEKNETLYYSLLGCQLTLSGGLSPYGANAFAVYGFVEVLLGNYDKAYRFGKLAIRMLDRFDCREMTCSTMFLVLPILLHWREPLQNFGAQLVQAGNSGLSEGDALYGTVCLSQGFFLDTWVGVKLPALENRMRAACRRISDLGQSEMLIYIQPILQHVLQLQSNSKRWQDIVTLTGEVMNEEDYIQHCRDANLNILIPVALKFKFQLACHFGLYGLAETLFNNINSMGKTSSSVATGTYAWNVFGAYLSFEQYQEMGNRKYLRRARKHMKGLERMVAVANSPNAPPCLAFLVAEEMGAKQQQQKGRSSPVGQHETLINAYDRAIRMLAEHKMLQFEGLANERAGFTLSRLGCPGEAQKYFDRALDIYQNEWVAVAKYNWLWRTN